MHASVVALSVLSLAIVAVKAQIPANTQVLLEFGTGTAGPCLMNNGEEDGGPVYVGTCPTQRTPHDSNMYWNVVNGGFAADGQHGPTTEIKFFGGTKCLDVTDGSTANGALLQLWECSGGPNQQFSVNPSDFTISWAGKGKCIDLPSGNTAYGTRIQLWDCDSSNPNQKWGFAFPPSVVKPLAPVGVPIGIINAGVPPQSSVCFSAANNYSSAAVVTGVFGDPTPLNQRWTFVHGGAYPSSTLSIGPSTQIQVFGNQCLDLTDGNTAPGTQLQLWECATEGTNPNQQWTFNSDNTITLAINATVAIELKDGSLAGAIPLVVGVNGHLPKQLWAAITPTN